MKPLLVSQMRAVFLALLLIGIPLLGLIAAGRPLAPYLEFPPRTRYVVHAPFSWVAFGLIGFLVVLSIWPFGGLFSRGRHAERAPAERPAFPWWGWLGALLGAVSWILAWNRFEWFARLQPHTFLPLWISFILVVNALDYRRRGRCLMRDHPLRFILLFPVSAVFWWFFEYLNRFVQNWYYTGSDYPPLTYFTLASLSFATVLPAVLSVREWLLSLACFQRRGVHLTLPSWIGPRTVAMLLLAIASLGLACIGLWPDYLFPLLWTSPLVIMLALQMLGRGGPLLAALRGGRWPVWAAAALAGLLCGFFWEMWNMHSLARWEYSIPWVDRFHLFEMPLLGYAGYLPFGLECALIGDALLGQTYGLRTASH